MLSEKVNALRARCESLKALQHGHINAQLLQTRARSISQSARKLSEINLMLAAWNPSTLPNLPRAEALLGRLKGIRDSFANPAESVMNDLTEVSNALHDFSSACVNKVGPAWAAYAAAKVPAGSEEAVAAVSEDPDQMLAITTIRRLALALERLKNPQVLTPDEVKAFEDTVVQLAEKLSNINVSAVPSEVRKFITDARANGTTIASLDGDVLAWLKEKGIAEEYQVTHKGF